MPASIGFIVLIGNILLALRRPKAGVWLYLVLSFIFPHSQIAGRAVSYEILGFLPLLGCVLFLSRGKVRRPNSLYIFAPLYPFLVLFSTWVSVSFYGFPMEWLNFLGLIRFCVILYIFIEFLDEDYIFYALVLIVAVNLLVCTLQLAMPSDTISIFNRLYGKETHAVLERYAELGRFARPTGTLLSPVNVGVLVIISFSIFLHRAFSFSLNSNSLLSIILAISTGILSLTKTAMLGVPVISLASALVFFVLVSNYKINDFKFRLGYVFFVFISVLAAILVSYYIFKGLYSKMWKLWYYIEFIVKPFEAFDTRYSEGGTLGETIDVISRYPILGLGTTRAQGEFLGDSTMIRVVHSTGIIGFILHISMYLYISYKVIMSNDLYRLLVLLSLFLSGLALFTFYTKYGAVVVSYCLLSGTSYRLD